ncbi:MAG: hypothetical protein ACI9DO_003605, partial [Reinekea sp.]
GNLPFAMPLLIILIESRIRNSITPLTLTFNNA